MPQNQLEKIPVYWMDDPILWSPCVFGSSCGICVAHSLGKKMRTPCLRLRPVKPAFYLPVKSALAMVKEGTAERYYFTLRDLNDASAMAQGFECIKLTYAKLAQLRDQSSKTNEDILIRYAAGDRRARASIDGWEGIRIEAHNGVKQVSMAEWSPDQMAESQQRIQSFV